MESCSRFEISPAVSPAAAFAGRCLGRVAGIGHYRGQHSQRAERTGPSRRDREQQENGGIGVPPPAPGQAGQEQPDTDMAGDQG